MKAFPKCVSYVVSVCGQNSSIIFLIMDTLNPVYLTNNEAIMTEPTKPEEGKTLGIS